MLTKRHIISAIIAATLSFGGAMSAVAAPPSKSHAEHRVKTKTKPQARHIIQAQRSISPAEAKSIARSRVPGGEVVDISRRGDTYRVRVIAKNGKVVDVYIDANTGRVKR